MSEYWIHEDGGVDFADGDVGDYNHEGVVIRQLQSQIINAVNRVCDPADKRGRSFYGEEDDWDEWKQAVAESWAKELIEKDPQRQEKIEKVLDYDPDKLLMGALKAAGIKKNEWSVAEGSGDARNYAMATWGWKTYRDGNVETWRLTRQDLKAIMDGLSDISNEDGWSEKKFQKYRYSINVIPTGKHFYLTIAQMEKWLTSPSAAVTTQDSTEEELMNKAASQGTRQQALDLMHPHYRNRPGVNPFGDSVMPSFEDFLVELKQVR